MPIWPSHDIVITNIVSCMALEWGGRWGGACCAMAVHVYCNRMGFAGEGALKG